ncbi:MAG: indole-3-glycerol phosphate synthase TrpC [Syntrophobacteraceae bacterium]|nr:indole-3-glycerol phosphate synthase TrpC [Desulfobacteraceae bacterium]
MAGDFLNRILERKREEVEERKKAVPEEELAVRVQPGRERRPFLERLSTTGSGHLANIIAEIKRASPSKGPLDREMDAPARARAYESGGAAAVSVLTDHPFFQARPGDLESVRSAVRLPVLRKDFLISSYQVYESAVMGADAVLLIVRALSPALLESCLGLCADLGLDALVEVRSAEEMDAATCAGARLIGINNRDLGTFRTDIRTSVELAGLLRPGQIAVSESGIHGREQVKILLAAGIRNFLIGESLVKAADPERSLRHLLGTSPGESIEPVDSGKAAEGRAPAGEGRS